MNAQELKRSLGRLDHVASAQESLLSAGTAAGTRVLDIKMWDGVDAQILLDRGFDLGPAWYRGVPVAWASRLGHRRPLSTPLGAGDWIRAFGGGLLTTCGLSNVGTPSEGEGQHGNFSHQPADDVSITRELAPDGQVMLSASATMLEGSALGPLFELRRRWTFRTGEGAIELSDTVTNLGGEIAPAPILYHINFGSPFWSQGAWLEGPGGEVLARDAAAELGLQSWDRAPELQPHAPEWVFEHVLPEQSSEAWPSFRIYSPHTGVRCTVEWDRSTLPRAHQWLHPASTINVLGIEPSNCGLHGRAFDRAEGRLPVLAPEETRTTRLRISFAPDVRRARSDPFALK